MPTSRTRHRDRVKSKPPRVCLVALVVCATSIGLVSAASGQTQSPERSPSATSAGIPAASPQPFPGATVEVQAYDLGFSPIAIQLPSAGTSRIVLHNVGFVPHNLTVDALGIQVVAARGLTSETTVTDPAPGTYEFYCSVSGHKEGGMVGTLLVQESAPVGPTGAPTPSPIPEGPTASG